MRFQAESDELHTFGTESFTSRDGVMCTKAEKAYMEAKTGVRGKKKGCSNDLLSVGGTLYDTIRVTHHCQKVDLSKGRIGYSSFFTCSQSLKL